MFLCSALKQIRDHLKQGHHKRALAVLKAAMVTWPEYSMFVTPEKDEKDKEGEERYVIIIESLSTDVFEPRTSTGSLCSCS